MMIIIIISNTRTYVIQLRQSLFSGPSEAFLVTVWMLVCECNSQKLIYFSCHRNQFVHQIHLRMYNLFGLCERATWPHNEYKLQMVGRLPYSQDEKRKIGSRVNPTVDWIHTAA